MLRAIARYGIYIVNTYLGSIFFGKEYLGKPTTVSFGSDATCPLRCINCNYWKQPVKRGKLSLHEKIQLILELKKWLGNYSLLITGGEPFTTKDTLKLVEFASKNNIETSVISNGYLFNSSLVEQVIKSGLTNITFSLDGSTATIHDHSRGVAGSYDKVINTIKLLKKHRIHKTPKIFINTLIMKNNQADLLNIYRLAKKLKISGISFQPVIFDSYFLQKSKVISDLWPDKPIKLINQINKLIECAKSDQLIKTPMRLLFEYKKYFLGKKINLKCGTAFNNFVVNKDGFVKLCYSDFPIGNIKYKKPGDLWNSQFANYAKSKTLLCQKSCKLIPCNFNQKTHVTKALCE